MKKSLLIYLFLFLLVVPAWAADNVKYLATLNDLPLSAQMKENVDESMVFDIPQGRIVEVIAFTPETKEQVTAFYQKTLPALGWVRDEDLTFHRDREKLVIRINAITKRTIVQFTLSPL